MQEKDANKNLNVTVRYVIALTMIAVLSSVAFYSINRVLHESDSTAYIVNISGKQRMLSQRIALDIHRIHQALAETANMSTYESRLSEEVLSRHVTEFLEANRILSTGQLPNREVIALSPKIKEIYFGSMNLAERVKEYGEIALKIIGIRSEKEAHDVTKQIDSRSEQLLIDLNKAVQRYQLEGEERLEDLGTLESIVWFVTIVMLLLEVIFIFQPMARKIANISESNASTLRYLENLVETRSLHLENANKKLADLAMHDPLTGLKNRLNLEQDIEDAIIHHEQNGAHFAVLMFDIDWFKSVNDTYGHDAGDTVLVKISSLLQHSVRENDHVYRAGGEEFVILMNRIGLTDTMKVAEKIRQTVEHCTFDSNHEQFHRTVSGGLYHSSLVKTNQVHDVMKLVDNALYYSKAHGKNQVTNVNMSMENFETSMSIPKTEIIFKDSTLDQVTHCDVGIKELIGYSCNDLSANKPAFKALVHEQDRGLLIDLPAKLSTGQHVATTIRLICSNGHVCIMRMEACTRDDEVVCQLQSANAIAEPINDKRVLDNFQVMLDNTDDFIYFKDRHHVFTAVSRSLVSLTPLSRREELIGKTDYEVFAKELADEYFILEREVFDGKKEVAHKLQPILNKAGEKQWVDNRKYPIKNSNGDIIGLFGIARILSESEAEQQEED